MQQSDRIDALYCDFFARGAAQLQCTVGDCAGSFPTQHYYPSPPLPPVTSPADFVQHRSAPINYRCGCIRTPLHSVMRAYKLAPLRERRPPRQVGRVRRPFGSERGSSPCGASWRRCLPLRVRQPLSTDLPAECPTTYAVQSTAVPISLSGCCALPQFARPLCPGARHAVEERSAGWGSANKA